MKLILLDAVLAIIDRLFDKHSSKHDIDEAGVVLLQLRENVESLEVKEVDLQSEIDLVWDNTSDNFSEDGWKEFEDIAKHFFELGVNASNPLTWEDIKLIWTIGDEIPYMPEEDFFKELLKRFKDFKERKEK